MPTIVGVTAEATVNVLKGDISKREGRLNTESLGARQNHGNTRRGQHQYSYSKFKRRADQGIVPVEQENKDQSQNTAVSCSAGVGAYSAGAPTPLNPPSNFRSDL